MADLIYDAQFQCTATAKTTGQRCRRRRHPGTTVCTSHGARAPQVQAAAERRLREERLTGELGRLLAELEIEAVDVSPTELLLAVMRRTWAMTSILTMLVGGLDPAEVIETDHLTDRRPNPLVDLLGLWSDRASRVAKMAIDAGIAERQVRVTEEQGRQLAEVLRSVLVELGHNVQAPEVRTVVGRHLRALAAG